MASKRFVRWACVCSWIWLGCGDDVGAAGELIGRTFLLESSQGFSPVPGESVRLSFHEGRFSVYAGCNHLGAEDFAIDGDVLVVRSWSSTEIGCDAARHAQDQMLEDFFTSSPTIAIDGDRITLTKAPVTLVFLDRELADPDRPLEGHTWLVDTFIENDGATNLSLPRTPTIVFEAGTVEVDTTCNTGSGSYVIEGEQLTLQTIAYSERGCDGASAEAERSIQAVLQAGSVRFEIEASRLTLTRGNRGLSAQAEE
jgi:heat shock protein HslJ